MIKKGFIKELRWRGLLHNITPKLEKLLDNEMLTAYIGFDPTADSLHVGNLVPLMLLKHFQNFGHKPIILIGGATGMVGDPSGKTKERLLLDKNVLQHNLKCQQQQLKKFLNFEDSPNKAEIVNNFDWFKDFSFLDFIRNVGKHISVNYMLAKDSVKSRLEAGMSFTEFSYQLVQGYDFLKLYNTYNCKLQMGGSDQWGNIVTGLELIRRKSKAEAHGLTAPLIKKTEGGKFGKSEEGNIWLDEKKTSPYHFYQYWLNISDIDAVKYIRTFTFLPKEEIMDITLKHNNAKHQRLLQKILATDITQRVHSKKALQMAINASEILFGNATTETLKQLDEKTFLSIFKGVPQFKLARDFIDKKPLLIELCTTHANIFSSKAEFRRLLQNNAISVNKIKIKDPMMTLATNNLLAEKYILLQKGKKNYYLLVF